MKPSQPNIQDVIKEWDALVDDKWVEFRAKARRGFRPFLSPYSPQWTLMHDYDQRRKTRRMIMAWTEEFFRDRGHAIECIPDDDNNDGFAFRMANVSDQATASE